MSTRLVAHQFRYDLRSFMRDKQARFTTLILPIILLLVLVSVGGGNKRWWKAAGISRWRCSTSPG